MYLLDTNILNAVFDGVPRVTRRLAAATGDVYSTTIVAEEILNAGLFAEIKRIRDLASKSDHRLTHEQLITRIKDLADFPLLPYSKEAEEDFKLLKRTVKRIGGMDGRIAAHARVLGYVLVTENSKDFEEVPDLRLENWLSEG